MRDITAAIAAYLRENNIRASVDGDLGYRPELAENLISIYCANASGTKRMAATVSICDGEIRFSGRAFILAHPNSLEQLLGAIKETIGERPSHPHTCFTS